MTFLIVYLFLNFNQSDTPIDMCQMVNVETHACSLPWTSATETSSRVKTVKAYKEEPGFAMTAS
jgi:hypothetical protein